MVPLTSLYIDHLWRQLFVQEKGRPVDFVFSFFNFGYEFKGTQMFQVTFQFRISSCLYPRIYTLYIGLILGDSFLYSKDSPLPKKKVWPFSWREAQLDRATVPHASCNPYRCVASAKLDQDREEEAVEAQETVQRTQRYRRVWKGGKAVVGFLW